MKRQENAHGFFAPLDLFNAPVMGHWDAFLQLHHDHIGGVRRFLVSWGTKYNLDKKGGGMC